MLKVLHVINTLDPEAGGPPLVATRLAAAQAALGAEVHLLAHRTPGADGRVRALLELLPGVHRLRFHDLPAPGTTGRRLGWGARRLVEQHVARADWVHLHGVWDPILRPTAAAARRLGKPYAVAPHGMLDPWSLGQKRLKKRVAMLLGYRRMLDGASFLHVLNADERRLVGPLKLRCPAVVIPNGVFLEELDPLPEPGTFRAAHPALGDAPYVLFLSRLHHKKGLDVLAEAFAGVARERPDVRPVVAGPDGGARQPFERQVAGLGLAGRVHVVGPLYGADKLAALVDAACFCLPSRQEGFSVAVLEALACGVPVVVSDACHFPEVAEVGAGRVVPLDASAVATALAAVLASAEVRRRMGEAGRELVRNRFTWPAIARLSLDAYQDATRARLPSRSGLASPG